MKILSTFLLIFTLSSCSVQLTPESIIYQDEEPEIFPDLSLLQSKLKLDPSELVLRKVTFDTQDEITLRGIFLEHNRPIANILLLVGEDDTVTPPRFAEAIYASSESVRKRLAVFPDIDHGRSMAGKDAAEFYRKFISTDVSEFLSVDP